MVLVDHWNALKDADQVEPFQNPSVVAVAHSMELVVMTASVLQEGLEILVAWAGLLAS